MPEKRGNILDLVGNTPMVPVTRLAPNPKVQILAKLESFNPGGSIKDRTALKMIETAERSGELTPQKIILEATSGNTGIGLSLVAAVKGYRILLAMSEAASEERVKILRALGAEIRFTPAHMGTDGAIEECYRLAREEGDTYWLADQFNSEANWLSHYEHTGPEIWEQTNGRLDALVATMGTSGTLMGLSRRFKEYSPSILIVGVEPYLGHKIQGLKNMKESYRPGIFDKKRLDRVINIDDDEAYETARLLARHEGLFVGMSSGAAMAAAFRMAREMPGEGRIVVILPDGGERYLSTPLFATRRTTGLRLFNTLARRKEVFVPLKEHQVSLYSCGPTLCGDTDLGLCRRMVFTDLLKRYLTFKGYQVTHIVNLTDLDDRTLQGAEREGISLGAFTDRYYEGFLRDMDRLGIRRASAYPRATGHVEDMLALAGKLVERGYAYEKFHSIYFDISRYRDYGRLSGIDLERIQPGKTVDLDQYEKENPRDFTLLKRSTLRDLKKGVFYQTRWGNVRPSWHLECAAIALKYLGPTYDIHTSGVELLFPHHENTSAIGHAVTDRPLAQYWVHNEAVLWDGKKTGCADGSETPTLEGLIRMGFTGREVRHWLLSRHYRKPIAFSLKGIEGSRSTLRRLDAFVQKLHACGEGAPDPDLDQRIYDLRHRFVACMDDDLNVAPALAALFLFLHPMNRIMDRKGLAHKDRDKILEVLTQIDGVFSLLDLEAREPDGEIAGLIARREEARKRKDWALADALRRELADKGVEIKDTREGTAWKRREG